MEREDCNADVSATENVLIDLTNSNGKRGISTLAGKFVTSHGTGMKVDKVDNNESCAKRTRKELSTREEMASGFTTLIGFMNCENVDSKAFTENTGDGQRKSAPPLKPRQLYQSIGSVNSSGIKKSMELSSALNPGHHFIRCSVREATQASNMGDSYIPSIAATNECNLGGKKSIALAGVGKQDTTLSGTAIENDGVYAVDLKENVKALENVSNNSVDENLINGHTSKATISENNAIPLEHRSKSSFGASSPLCGLPSQTPCNTDEVHSMANSGCNPQFSTIRLNPSSENCSCPSCLKAAYIWADLLYQDARGRLNEIKKTRREARILAGKSYNRDVGLESNGNGAGKFKKFTKPEFDIMERWRSLLLHTENSLVAEGTKLEDDMSRLKKMKENFMKDMQKNTVNFSIQSRSASGDFD